MNIVILLTVGYILGSLSPGYFFGRIVKGIDIRKFGSNKNTGAANTYYVVGPAYGIITGIFDALKALATYLIAVKGLPLTNLKPLEPDMAILVGLAAVAGHIWPFYLRFRGGRGMASLLGLAAIILFFTASWNALVFIAGAIIFGVILISRRVEFEAPIRKILKLGAIVFPLSLFWLPGATIFKIVGYLLVGSIFFEIIRLLLPRFDILYIKSGLLAKLKERRRLSGYTLFLTSMYVVLRFFPPEVAIFVMLSFVFADLLAPIGKEVFLPVPLIKEKTLGGFSIIFCIAVLVGLFLHSLASLPLSTGVIISGAASMAILDQFSFFIDDNILVPIGTAIILTFII